MVYPSSLPRRSPPARPQRGFGLIEVLVAIVILAFGMLGLLGLQTRSLGLNQSSLYRSQATALTDDILDRMRVDRVNARAGRWNTGLTSHSGSISGTNLYETDLQEWKLQIEALLPSGEASITVNGTQVTVVVQWDDSRGREAPQQFMTQSQI